MRYFLLVFLLSPTLAMAADSQLQVGFAEVDVTPTVGGKPVYMAGFGQNRPAKGVHDPLMARAVVLSDGQAKVALVSVDVVGLFQPSVENIRKQLPGYLNITVSSTHNHEGPDTLGLWGPSPFASGVDAEFLKKVEDCAAMAVKAADKALAPAIATIGTAATADLIRDARLPEVKHDTLTTLVFHSPDGKTKRGILVQWNNHPEDLGDNNTLISADFVGGVVAKLKTKYACPVAYFTGTVGGLMTSLQVEVKDAKGVALKAGSYERLDLYAGKVVDRAVKAVDAALPVTLTPFSSQMKDVLIPVDNNIYRIAWQVGILRRPLYLWQDDPTPKQFNVAKDLNKPVGIKTEIGLLTLGDVGIAIIPGEIYPELVLDRIQDPVDPGADFPNAPKEPAIYPNMKSKHKMIFGLANDELGYILPKRQWDEKAPYCYGLKKAQYGEMNSVGPEAGPILCDVFKALATGK